MLYAISGFATIVLVPLANLSLENSIVFTIVFAPLGKMASRTPKASIPQTTRYKNRWGVRIFEDRQSGRENKAVMCESNPFSLDLQNLQNLETELCSMTAGTLNFWLSNLFKKFATRMASNIPGVQYIKLYTR